MQTNFSDLKTTSPKHPFKQTQSIFSQPPQLLPRLFPWKKVIAECYPLSVHVCTRDRGRLQQCAAIGAIDLRVSRLLTTTVLRPPRNSYDPVWAHTLRHLKRTIVHYIKWLGISVQAEMKWMLDRHLSPSTMWWVIPCSNCASTISSNENIFSVGILKPGLACTKFFSLRCGNVDFSRERGTTPTFDGMI